MIIEKRVPGSAMGSSNGKGNALAQAVEAAGFACTATPAGFREVRSHPVPGIDSLMEGSIASFSRSPSLLLQI